MASSNPQKILMNLKTDSNKESVFFVGVILMNLYISNKRNCLTEYETQAFCTIVEQAHSEIFRHSNNWAEKYQEKSNELVSMSYEGYDLTDKYDLYAIISNAVRNGFLGITAKDGMKIMELYNYLDFILPSLIPSGNKEALSDVVSYIKTVMKLNGFIEFII